MNITLFFEKRVGWTRYTIISMFLVISFILDLIISIPTLTTTPRLSGIKATSTIQLPSPDGLGMDSVVIGIGVGASEGCMWFGEVRQCRYTLNFQPSSGFLHLPPNQNVTNHFPSGRILASCHVTTALQAMVTTSFMVGPFVPVLFTLTIILLPITVVMSMFSGISLLIVSAQVAYQLRYSIPKFEDTWGFDFVFAFVVVFFQVILSFWVGCLRCRMPKKTAPPADATSELEMGMSRR
ncbi:hypothetical protein I302_102225 [Kwoniella bestiolae CBS 10118]|uniref:Uncharacterized protein n=1 Tax=Kwoniella bestiolae CBS 10118 TaxID=1296100 RepID=A0AAJ8K3R1_9TREE